MFLGFLLSVFSILANTPAPLQASVMSFNIRYNSPNDGVNIWENRVDKVIETIEFYEPTFLGLQEATKTQMDDIEPHLEQYSWIGVGREDGIDKGEFAPIFYLKSQVQLVKQGTFWLAPDPNKITKGWDAALPRIATWGIFKLQGTHVFVLNTHYDHRGEKARKESSELILQQLGVLNPKNYPIIVMGDLNATVNEAPLEVLLSQGFRHCRKENNESHLGPIETFNGFKAYQNTHKEIDHILVSQGIEIEKTATLANTWQGKFASDHHPVFANITFQ